MASSPWKIKSAGAILATLVITGAVAALFAALRIAQSEADRDSLGWQRQMAVVINSREVAVEEWLAEQEKVIVRLAENPSLRIYLGNIDPDSGGLDQEGLAQAAYLENQLKAVALQNGYADTGAAYGVDANLPQVPTAGLALTTPGGQLIVATPQMPSVIRSVADYMERGAGSDAIIFGPYRGENGTPLIAFVAPVFGVQDDKTSPAIGFAVGIKPLPGDFFRRLAQPGDTSRSARTYLVRRRADVIEYLSPVTDHNGEVIPPLTLALNAHPSLAASFAVENAGDITGGFAERMDYDGEKVLVTGRRIAGTDWTMLRTVQSAEVMGAINARQRNIIWIAGLTILALSITILLIWRHGVSVRVAQSAEKQRILTRKYEKLSHFLQVVSDSQPTVITAVDDQGRYSFANAQAAADSGVSGRDLVGQKVAAVHGPLTSPKAADYCRQVLESADPLSVVERLPGGEVTIKADYIPLFVNREKGVLMVTEDISELVRERERRVTALKSLVHTLTMVIDSRDPHSARHSERVALVARTIAGEMAVDPVTLETAEIAGAMMNLGKIMVPRELLTRPKGLSEEELATIRGSIMKSADMLEMVDFDGPVVKTLRQTRAHWDGSGLPEGLAGEDILPSARIVAVANAFVGMVSARAHRPGMALDKAILLLFNDADRIYDRRPVAALMNYLENKGGLEEWRAFCTPLTPETPAVED